MKAFLLSIASFLFFAGVSFSASHDRITSHIDSSRTVRLPHTIRTEATGTNDRGPLDLETVIDGVTLVIPPSAAQQIHLDAFLEAQRDPSSADFRHWLTPEEFAERFGASENDINAVAAWLRSKGLTVDEIARGRNFIVASGTAGQLSAAFDTAIRKYQADGKLHFANSNAPAVPEALHGFVTEIRGLDDFRPEPAHLRINSISPDYTAASGNHYVAPDDYSAIYNTAGLYEMGVDGTGQRIVVVGQTDISLTDIQAFRAKFNLPANDPQVVLAGSDPGVSKNDQAEAHLDIEWSGAVARNATIIYVNSRNVLTSVQYAVNQNLAPVISMSYGGCEQDNSSSIRALAQQANSQGITWIASSGDSGAAGCEASNAKVAVKGLGVNIPASIPEVTGVGGTSFAEGTGSYWAAANNANGASASGYIPESAWNDVGGSLSSTGGGASIFYAKPAWQSGTGVPNDGMRDVPDLSFNASAQHDGYLFYTGGALGAVGGTSVPTPAFAGVVGLLNQYLLKKGTLAKAGLGNINPTLYQVAAAGFGVFHDVTTGSNMVPCTVGTKNCTTGNFGFNAGVGYDQVTGLGSADLFKLVTSWTGVVSSTSTSTSLTAAPSAIAQSASTQLTAMVRAVSGSAVPSGTVTFTSGGKVLGTAGLGTGSTAIATVPGSALAIGANSIVATYGGNTTFAGSSATAVVTVTAPAAQNSNVIATVNPNPVVGTNGTWTFTILLSETAGVATTLTDFKFNGTSYAAQIPRFFGSSAIAAKGTLTARLRVGDLTKGAAIPLIFSGQDANGHQWTQTVSVTFN